MSGIPDLGDRALAGRTGPTATQKAADFNQLGLRVTPENVLGVYAAVAEEVIRLRSSLRNFRSRYRGGMPLLGNGQPVSPYFSKSFDESTAKLMALCESDVEDLSRVADGLHAAARAYGKSEEQIAGAFDPGSFVYSPAPISGPPGQRQATTL